MSYISKIDETSSAEIIGRKAFNLNRLFKYGFNVPYAYFISISALIDYLKDNGLEHLLKKTKATLSEAKNLDKCKKSAALLRQAIYQGSLNNSFIGELEDLILNNYKNIGSKVAVRSSSVNEDLEKHSFAGQYASILNVALNLSNLEESIKNVWASQWSDSIIAYSFKHGLDAPQAGMGVIIQQMIDAEIAGVLFSFNPYKFSKDEMIIEYVNGLGEALVSGEKTPEHLVYQRKKRKFTETPDNQYENIFSTLISKAEILEKKAGSAVDIEWAYAQKLYLLQMRSVTTATKMGVLWTDENVGEVIPDIVTPYSWSILNPITNSGFESFLKEIKVKNYSQQRFFGLYKGKVYFNSSAFQYVLEQFYISTYTKSLEQSTSFFSKYTGLIKLPFILSRVILNFVFFSKRLPERILAHLRDHKNELELNKFKKDQGYEFSYKAKQNLLSLNKKTMFFHISDTILAELFYQFLAKICSRWLSENGSITADKLLIGLDAAESAKSGVALWSIAQKIEEFNLQGIFEEKDNIKLEKILSESEKGKIVLDKLDSFIIEYGHEALHEFELLYPRWWEDKQFIYSNIRSYLKNINFDLFARKIELSDKRKIMLNKALKKLKGSQKWLFNYLYKKAIFYSTQRENLKQQFLKAHSEIKKHLFNIGKHYHSLKIIEKTEDILFLENDEIDSLIKSELHIKNIKDEIYHRRSQRQEFCLEKHPKKIIQIGDTWRPFFDKQDTNEFDLSGIGCSSGIVEGKVCILHDPEEFDNLKQGDILVTRSTNPAWTPLFVLASAVITEIGGALSHGAIIAREYGIPMIAAVKDVTKSLKSGDIVKVNGDSGTIQIVRQGEKQFEKSTVNPQ